MHNERRLESEILIGVERNPIQTELSTKHFSLLHTVAFAYLWPFISSIHLKLKQLDYG